MIEEVGIKTERRVINGRPFELREYTLEDTGAYIDGINEAMKREQESWHGVGSMAEVYDRVAGSLEPTFARILQHPLDDLGPVDAAFLKAIRLSQRKRLLELQGQLNSLEDEAFVGKCVAVLQAVSAWRTASTTITGAGKQPTSSPPSIEESPRLPSLPRGPLGRLWAFLRGLRGMIGASTT